MELDSISGDQIINPNYLVEKDDHVVGTASDMVQKLFTLGKMMQKDAAQMELDAKFCSNLEEQVGLLAKYNELQAKAAVLKELFWIGVRDEFALWNKSVGIRIDYTVVWNDKDEMPPIARMFGLGG
uniref:Uncharacterized protein n=1 Tax=viral metagenome TaxID=1070528 RepID=A0A6M3KK32_9ZZZZ